MFKLMKLLPLIVCFSLLAESKPKNVTSSISDRSLFKKFCLRATEDEEVFALFKQDPIFNEILEHLSPKLGKKYLKYIQKHYPTTMALTKKFAENDSIGGARTIDHGNGIILSPSTLRYIKIACDIKTIFGSLDGKRIVEIGGGYGGQCKILSDFFPFKQYVLMDLYEMLLLANKYLNCLSVPNVSFKTMQQITDHEVYDLVISNYAFSECSRKIQEMYLQKVILKSKSGYMLLNRLEFSNPSPYSPKELGAYLESHGFDVTITPETPETFSENVLLVWKQRNT